MLGCKADIVDIGSPLLAGNRFAVLSVADADAMLTGDEEVAVDEAVGGHLQLEGPSLAAAESLDIGAKRQRAADLRSDLQTIDNVMATYGSGSRVAGPATFAMRAWAVEALASLEAAGF